MDVSCFTDTQLFTDGVYNGSYTIDKGVCAQR